MGSAKFDVICHSPQVGVCGLNCKHCWVTDNLKQHKPLDEVKQMIDAMAELREEPVIAEKTILYFLDELTLHPQVIEILRYCRERDVLPQQFLVSNGLGIATRDNWKEILNELGKCGLKGFLMTINGDEEYHDCSQESMVRSTKPRQQPEERMKMDSKLSGTCTLQTTTCPR